MVQGSRLHMHTYWLLSADLYYCILRGEIRGLVQSPCGKISVIMTLGGRGLSP